jgi:hypothetical protein
VTDRFARHAFGTVLAAVAAICLQKIAGLVLWLAMLPLGTVNGAAFVIGLFLFVGLAPGFLAFTAAAFALARWMGVRDASNWILALGVGGVLVNLATQGVVAVVDVTGTYPYLRAALAIAPMLGSVAGWWFAGRRR